MDLTLKFDRRQLSAVERALKDAGFRMAYSGDGSMHIDLKKEPVCVVCGTPKVDVSHRSGFYCSLHFGELMKRRERLAGMTP